MMIYPSDRTLREKLIIVQLGAKYRNQAFVKKKHSKAIFCLQGRKKYASE
jgi:hypothetical protein